MLRSFDFEEGLAPCDLRSMCSIARVSELADENREQKCRPANSMFSAAATLSYGAAGLLLIYRARASLCIASWSSGCGRVLSRVCRRVRRGTRAGRQSIRYDRLASVVQTFTLRGRIITLDAVQRRAVSWQTTTKETAAAGTVSGNVQNPRLAAYHCAAFGAFLTKIDREDGRLRGRLW
jgi:hypothetical protein